MSTVASRMMKPSTRKDLGVYRVTEKKESFEPSVLQQLRSRGICPRPGCTVFHNPPASVMYEEALRHEPDSAVSSSGALATLSGQKTGRSPADKRIVDEPTVSGDVWWGPVNIRLTPESYSMNRERALDFLGSRQQIFVTDGFAGWDRRYRIKVRTVSTRAYHALFMQDMLLRPTQEEMAEYGEPEFWLYNAGDFVCSREVAGNTSGCSIDVSFERREMVLLGSLYAGEMKKGVFTIMHYLMPKAGVLSLHASANEGEDPQDVSLFFGLSGTGKTTLSADPRRKLIGDDEHCWTDTGVFNIEAGCYAKCAGLSRKAEPDIFNAIRFGSVLENVRMDLLTREVDFSDISITENTRAAYPIDFIPNAKIPCVSSGHPRNLVFLTCDAFGVLPPVSRLTPRQAVYHFLSGYTAKVAGTETGVLEPQATFSSCFGQPFLVWHPTVYGRMLEEKMTKHGSRCWLVNTGWTGGRYGVGKRISLSYSRAIIDAIHAGQLDTCPCDTFPVFGLLVPQTCPGVPSEVLHPERCWKNRQDFDATVDKLASLFKANFAQFGEVDKDVLAAGPQ